MSRTAHNINLYRFDASGARHPVLTLTPGDAMGVAKVVAQVGHEMRLAQLRGVDCPVFRIVSEKREADEGGQFVIRAEFVELDATLSSISRPFNSLQELFNAKPGDAAPQALPESDEQKAEREKQATSAALSV